MSAPADWEVLGLAPGATEAEVRAAYRARLRAASPERDPEGFQRLRAAYDAVMAGFAAPAPEAPEPGEAPADPAAAALLARVNEHRAAGDEAGAIAAVDTALAAAAPGSAAHDAIEDALLEGIALDRTLSPRLFAHLAARFDWGDANGRAARADAERHSILADRLAAEAWWSGLHAGADPLGHALVARGAAAAHALLPPGGLDAEARARVRALFEELDAHAMFLLHRLDAGALAVLREAVEGPPLRSTDAPAAPTPSPPPPGTPAQAQQTRSMAGILGLVLASSLAFGAVRLCTGDAPRGGAVQQAERVQPPAAVPLATPDAAEARRRLSDPAQPWVAFRLEPAGVLVDLSPLVALRAAIAEARLGANVAEPATVLPVETGVPLRFPAQGELSYITLRVQFRDGTWSPVRRYDIPVRKGP